MACCKALVILLSVLGSSLLRTTSSTPAVQLYKNDYVEENLVPESSTNLPADDGEQLPASPLKPSSSGREKKNSSEKILVEKESLSSLHDAATPREMNVPLKPVSERERFNPAQDHESPVNVVSLIDYVVRRVQDEMVDSYCGLTQCSEPCGSRGKLDVEKCLSCIAPSFQDVKPVSVYHE